MIIKLNFLFYIKLKLLYGHFAYKGLEFEFLSRLNCCMKMSRIVDFYKSCMHMYVCLLCVAWELLKGNIYKFTDIWNSTKRNNILRTTTWFKCSRKDFLLSSAYFTTRQTFVLHHNFYGCNLIETKIKLLCPQLKIVSTQFDLLFYYATKFKSS